MDHMAIRVNLGCGDQQLPGYLGIDRLRRAGTHVLSDLRLPLPFASQSIDRVYAKSVLEHVEGLEDLFTEVHRVLKPEGTF